MNIKVLIWNDKMILSQTELVTYAIIIGLIIVSYIILKNNNY